MILGMQLGGRNIRDFVACTVSALHANMRIRIPQTRLWPSSVQSDLPWLVVLHLAAPADSQYASALLQHNVITQHNLTNARCTFSRISSTSSALMGPMYVRSAVPGSVMIVACRYGPLV